VFFSPRIGKYAFPFASRSESSPFLLSLLHSLTKLAPPLPYGRHAVSPFPEAVFMVSFLLLLMTTIFSPLFRVGGRIWLHQFCPPVSKTLLFSTLRFPPIDGIRLREASPPCQSHSLRRRIARSSNIVLLPFLTSLEVKAIFSLFFGGME